MSNQAQSTKYCDHCEDLLEGRKGKRFCDLHCRNSFHNESHASANSRYSKILKKLKANRRLLKKYNRAGLSFVEKTELIAAGFDPSYFTNYWKSQKGKVYLFCFEFGFREEKKGAKQKYTLIQWQDYMK